MKTNFYFKNRKIFTNWKKLKKINNVWIVLHGYGMLEYFVKKFECIIDETTLVIAPEATNRFYLANNYKRVGASWMTKLDREQEISDNILFLDKLFNNKKRNWAQ